MKNPVTHIEKKFFVPRVTELGRPAPGHFNGDHHITQKGKTFGSIEFLGRLEGHDVGRRILAQVFSMKRANFGVVNQCQ